MKNILDWLEQTTERYPDKIAFQDPGTKVTYVELVRKAKSVAHYLIQNNYYRKPIAFYMEKSTLAVCGMMGTVYAGGFYSFIDLRQPEARVEKVLSTLEPALIFTTAEHEDTVKKHFGRFPVAVLEDIVSDNAFDEQKLLKIRTLITDTAPLYVNFTSGSTGIPKGVAVSHRSVIDFIPRFTEQFHITESDIIANQAPFDFDVSVKDIYSGLFTGAKVVLIPREYFSAPTTLMDYLCDNEVTTLIWAVSAMCFVSIMNGFDYRNPTTVNKVIFSGEVMPVKQLNKWKQYLPDAMYVNVYGPTEITCNCTYYMLDHDFEAGETIPIGIPFDNENVFLLDEADHVITEFDKEGEICVAGTCLALGYYNSAEKTNEAFVQNPINTAYPERIYRTGDLGFYQEDGNLVYKGRKDFQIKHLGHRIELGEIESAANGLEQIEQCICLYDNSKKKLLLFYTGSKEKKDVLRELKGKLPPFMIPGMLFPLDQMPLTKNGKVDRIELKKIGGIK